MAEETVNVSEMLAEVRAEMNGEPKPEPKAEPVVEETQEEEQIESGEEQEEALEAEEDEAEEEEVAPEPKKKKSWLDRERAKKEEYKAQAESERLARERAERERDELRELLKGKLNAQPEKKDEKKVEPLDPESHNALLETMDEKERSALVRDFKREAKIETAIWTSKDPEHERKSELVVAHEAYNIASNAAAMGERITEEQAVELAKQNLSVALFKVYEKGGSMGEYIQTRAAAIASSLPKKQEEKAKPKTNLKELDALRKSAGAPTNKRAGGDSEGFDMSALLNEARDEVLKETRLGF